MILSTVCARRRQTKHPVFSVPQADPSGLYQAAHPSPMQGGSPNEHQNGQTWKIDTSVLTTAQHQEQLHEQALNLSMPSGHIAPANHPATAMAKQQHGPLRAALPSGFVPLQPVSTTEVRCPALSTLPSCANHHSHAITRCRKHTWTELD
jgi:hypothetical protein